MLYHHCKKNNTMSNTLVPGFVDKNSKTRIEQRLYNGRKIAVIVAKVGLKDVAGWVDNPRIDLAKKELQSKVGNRDLTQDEIFQLMKEDPEVKLNELRDDLIKNGLREPLTLTYYGKLLDGNRRFFALKYVLEHLPPTDPNRVDFEMVDAYILTADATEEDEQNVLVEENFSASLKIEWPDYVKATKVVEAKEEGLTETEIARKFGWKKTKVRETLRINEIIEDFLAFATAEVDEEDEAGGGRGMSENEATRMASKNYQYFNEAQKSFFEKLKSDFDFKVQFFNWIADGKFKSFPTVRVAHKVWESPEAKAALSQAEPAADKNAKAIIDYNQRIIRNTDEAVGRISSFAKFLRDLTAEELGNLPDEAVEKLIEALELVTSLRGALENED
jgi:hypothetical protein